jgi:glutamate-1-semialdehyde 2,1-aminomutase
VFINEGKGAVKYDVDGNELIDYMMGFGALLLGHADADVTSAVAARLSKGTHLGSLSELEIDWAELVTGLIPSAEQVRFTGSGTESTLLALRLARGHTGKTKVVKFREHFHGWHDYLSMDSGINTQVGIPDETLSTIVVIEPTLDALSTLLERDTNIAAVIMEPTGGHWGQFPLQNPGFLEGVRKLTTEQGVVMIMDEVICGFRLSSGGAQGRFGIMPDLTTMAKIVAGGLPGGAVAGKAEIMEMLGDTDPSRRLAHPGTFNANPVSATAGIATLQKIANEPINDRADAMSARLKAGLRDALNRTEIPGQVHGLASVVHIALGIESDDEGISTVPHDRLAKATAGDRSSMIKLAMLNEGVDMMGGIGFMVSAVHCEDDIDLTAEAFERALIALREERFI